jgi:hypothetical protein
MPEPNDIKLQRDQVLTTEIREVIAHRPHWIIRRGNVLLLIIVLSAVVLSLFIEYPVTTNGQAQTTAPSRSLWHHFWNSVKQPG